MTMRPETTHDPTVETIEELTDAGFAVMQAPAANDRIDLGDQLLRRHRSFATSPFANLILEVLDRFLARNRIQIAGADATANSLRRELQAARASFDLVPEKLKTVPNIHDASLVPVQFDAKRSQDLRGFGKHLLGGLHVDRTH